MGKAIRISVSLILAAGMLFCFCFFDVSRTSGAEGSSVTVKKGSITEREMMQSLQSKSAAQLRKMGYTDKQIKTIKNCEPKALTGKVSYWVKYRNFKSVKVKAKNKKKAEKAAKKHGDSRARKAARHGNLADFIVEHNKGIRNVVIVLVVFFAICFPFVEVNYDLTKYLPDTVDTKIAINKMRETFGYPGTGRLMLKDVTLYEAKQYKNQIEKIDGVDQVIWCDLTTNIYGSSEFINYDDIDDYYKDGNAVMDITFNEGDTSKRTHKAITKIDKLIGDRGTWSVCPRQTSSSKRTSRRKWR